MSGFWSLCLCNAIAEGRLKTKISMYKQMFWIQLVFRYIFAMLSFGVQCICLKFTMVNNKNKERKDIHIYLLAL